MVIFSLVQSFVQLGVDRLTVPDSSLEIFKFLDISIEESIETVAFFFESFSLIFQALDLDDRFDTVMARFLFYSLVL